MSDHTKPPSCYDCIHHSPCAWSPNRLSIEHKTPPFKSDAHIAPYLKTVNEATAQACGAFEARKDS